MQTSILTVIPSNLPKPRQRLLKRYSDLGSWWKVSKKLGVNNYYVYQYAVNGVEPSNDKIAKKLGIHRRHRHYRTINDHLAHDELIDMPEDLLHYALEHREPIA